MPEKKKKSEENKYGTKWVKFEPVKLGGLWAYAIGIVQDKASGEKKVRIAKGKVKGKVHWKGGVLEYEYADPDDPITQVNRLNIKNKEEWAKIKELVDKYLAELEK